MAGHAARSAQSAKRLEKNEEKDDDEKERHALLGDDDGDEDDEGGGFPRNARSNDRSQLSTMENLKTAPRHRRQRGLTTAPRPSPEDGPQESAASAHWRT